MYTAAPAFGLHRSLSTTVSSTARGTPPATPDAEPMLFVMSRRTTPSSVRTLGPLVPSPGKGPAVSSGICSQVEPAAVPPAIVVVVESEAPADVLVEPLAPAPPPPQPARTTAAPSPPNQVRSSRRLGVVVCGSIMPVSVPAHPQEQVAAAQEFRKTSA